jgi:hypothetical protein
MTHHVVGEENVGIVANPDSAIMIYRPALQNQTGIYAVSAKPDPVQPNVFERTIKAALKTQCAAPAQKKWKPQLRSRPKENGKLWVLELVAQEIFCPARFC